MKPIRNSNWWKKVVREGCQGYRDYYGEFDCGAKYPWVCDDCPIVIERMQSEDDQEEIDDGYFEFEKGDTIMKSFKKFSKS